MLCRQYLCRIPILRLLKSPTLVGKFVVLCWAMILAVFWLVSYSNNNNNTDGGGGDWYHFRTRLIGKNDNGGDDRKQPSIVDSMNRGRHLQAIDIFKRTNLGGGDNRNYENENGMLKKYSPTLKENAVDFSSLLLAKPEPPLTMEETQIAAMLNNLNGGESELEQEFSQSVAFAPPYISADEAVQMNMNSSEPNEYLKLIERMQMENKDRGIIPTTPQLSSLIMPKDVEDTEPGSIIWRMGAAVPENIGIIPTKDPFSASAGVYRPSNRANSNALPKIVRKLTSSTRPKSSSLPKCFLPQNMDLNLTIMIMTTNDGNLTVAELETLFPNVTNGGFWKPANCTARNKVTLIVPFRDRDSHLTMFLHQIISVLQSQNTQFKIFLIEQVKRQKFNRAKLMNVGVHVASLMKAADCFVFHDVDLLPLHSNVPYRCPPGQNGPTHLAVAMDKHNYTMPYKTFFGGVCVFTRRQFDKINGFPNSFWGWGGEDDDIARRVSWSRQRIFRPPTSVGRFRMIRHPRDKGNEVNAGRFKQIRAGRKRKDTDGYNSLDYKLNFVNVRPLFVHVMVDLIPS